jgi:PAS domain S-box-containing protein
LEDRFSLLVVTDKDRVIYATESPNSNRLGQIQGFVLPVRQIMRDEPVFGLINTFQATAGQHSLAVWMHVAITPPEGERVPRFYLSGLYDLRDLQGALDLLDIDQQPLGDDRFLQLIGPEGRVLHDTRRPPGADSAASPSITIPAEAFAETTPDPTPDNPATRQPTEENRPTAGNETEQAGTTTATATATTTSGGNDSAEPEARDQPRNPETAASALDPRSLTQESLPDPEQFTWETRQSDLTDLAVRAVVAKDVLARSADPYAGWLIGLIIFCAILAAAFGFPVAYRALEPFYRILNGAKVWQGGDINYFFRGREQEGEWAELAESMNAIAARMQALAFTRPERDPDAELNEIAQKSASPLAVEAAQVKSLLRGATESDSEGVLIVTPQGRILLANQRFHEVWQTGLAALDAGQIFRILRLTTRKMRNPHEMIGKIRQIVNDPETRRSGEITLLDGRVLSYSTSPYSVGDHIDGRIWRFRDVTSQRSTERHLRENKALLDGLIANVPAALHVKDVNDDFRVVIWNQSCEDIFGIPADEALHKVEKDLFPAKLAQAIRKDDLDAVRRGGVTEKDQQNLTSRTRGSILLRTLRVPLYDEHGAPTHLICLSEDTTSRHHNEQRLRREHSILRGLVDSLPNIISFKTHMGVYLGCNRRFEQLIGKTEAEIVGNMDASLFEDADPPVRLPPLIDAEMLRDGRPRQHRMEVKLPDHEETTMLDTVETPLRGPNGDVWGIIGISRRIRPQQKAQADRSAPSDEGQGTVGNK